MGDVRPSGTCWCGCGVSTSPTAFFVSGHDKIAEAAVVRAEYGSVARFIAAHGYGPGRKKPRTPASGGSDPRKTVSVLYRGGVEYSDRDVLLPVPRLIVRRDGDYWCPIDVLLSGPAHALVVCDEFPEHSDSDAMTSLLARFGASRVTDMLEAGALPYEQTDLVQRLAITLEAKPGQGANHVVPVAEFTAFLKNATEVPGRIAVGDLLHRFEASL